MLIYFNIVYRPLVRFSGHVNYFRYRLKYLLSVYLQLALLKSHRRMDVIILAIALNRLK